MTAIIKNRFRIQNAKDFLENFINHPIVPPITEGSHRVDRNHYLFVGRPREWPSYPGNTPPVGELYPPIPQDTIEEERRVWDGMLGLKKISQIYTSLCVPRHNWDVTGNTVYAKYDDTDPYMFSHPTPDEVSYGDLNGFTAGSLYVITDEYHVFLCLDNGRGQKSVVKPTLPLTAPFISDSSDQDGYRWKYITTITPAQIVKFLTDYWLPIVTLKEDDGSKQWDVQEAAVEGEIIGFSVDAIGSNYRYIHSGVLAGAGGNTAQLEQGASSESGVYVNAEVHILSGAGAGQVRTIVDYDANGLNRIITVDPGWYIQPNAGDEYEIVPKLNFYGNGTGLRAKVIVNKEVGPNQYTIKRILIINGGSGYTWAKAEIPTGSAGGSGAIIRPIIAPPGGLGKDPERLLGAFFVMLNVRLEYQEGAGDFPISNDYRQLGIIRDVKNFDGTLATANTRTACKSLVLENVQPGPNSVPFQPDEEIVGILNGYPNAKAKIVEYTPNESGGATIAFWQDPETGDKTNGYYKPFVVGMNIFGSLSGAQGTLVSVINEEVKKFEGEILYLENRRPILRAPDQIEDIKAIIEF